MITRVNGEQYLNIFEVAWLFMAAEFITAASYLKLYDVEADEWHLRRVFWTLAGFLLAASIVAGLVVTAVASAKYLVAP